MQTDNICQQYRVPLEEKFQFKITATSISTWIDGPEPDQSNIWWVAHPAGALTLSLHCSHAMPSGDLMRFDKRQPISDLIPSLMVRYPDSKKLDTHAHAGAAKLSEHGMIANGIIRAWM